jgi:hypothetical protein
MNGTALTTTPNMIACRNAASFIFTGATNTLTQL